MKYISIAVLMLLAAACSDKVEVEVTEKAIAVKTIESKFEEISIPVYFSGMLQAESEMKLSFKIGGIIQAINVEEGMKVRKNQVLATLDLTEINAGLAQAKAGYGKAKRDLQRAENLYADTVATLEQLQNTKTALEVAAANLKMAKFNQRYAQILAPADGVVLKRFGEENELIRPGTPVFVFSGKKQAWIIKGGLADQERIRVSPGDKAEIEFNLFADKKFKGVVISVAGSLDPYSATYTTEIVLQDKPENIVSGMMGKVKIIPSQKQMGCLMPVSALNEADGMNASVFVINQDNRVEKTSVRIAAITNDQVIVSSGIQNGLNIATEGAAYLMDGSLVQIANE